MDGGDIGNQFSTSLIESSIGLIGFILLMIFIGLTTLIVFAGFNFKFISHKEEPQEKEELIVTDSEEPIESENKNQFFIF